MTGDRLVVRNADIGRPGTVDVHVAAGRVTALVPHGGEVPHDAEVIEAEGGALLPGLHDHHLHLFALAAALRSVRCGPPDVLDADGLAAALRGAGPGWIRGVGYHESVAGPLDRWSLDRLTPDRPTRVQHRSGALWMLNSAAVDRVGLASADVPGVERRAEDGEPTGRLWRLDSWLRGRVPSEPVDLGAVGRQLVSFGITGVTDATPDLDDRAMAELAAATADGRLPVDLQLLGAPRGSAPHKIVLSDHDLPDFDDLAGRIRVARSSGRPVALHCVTRVALVLALAVFDELGAVAGDRIEHGAVVPPELVAALRRHGLRVVTQPGFVAERGDDYLDDVDPDDRPHLYPYGRLLAAGIPTAPSSDAPYAGLDPWATMSAARDRRTPTGRTVAPDEAVSVATVLAGYLSPLDAPGDPPRRIAPGAPADLVLLTAPLAAALHHPSATLVRLTLKSGQVVT